VSPKSTTAAEQYVLLEHKKTLRLYGVFIGFSNIEVRHVRNQLAVAVLSELGRSLSMSARCWSTFDVGRALNWPLFGIPYPRERSTGSSQFAQMIEYLVSVLEPIDGPKSMLDRLVSFEPPYDWISLNHPVRRAVEAVATAKVSGHDLSDVERKLLLAQSYLYKELRNGPRWPELIARICGH
jgi:hypothetical protein